jgi:hypothetical protein
MYGTTAVNIPVNGGMDFLTVRADIRILTELTVKAIGRTAKY